MNDNRYGAIKWLQDKMFKRSGEVDHSNPDFPAMARAFGARGGRLSSVDALPAARARAFSPDGPAVPELLMEMARPWEL